MEPGLENTAYYDPPNLTWPFAVYIVTVEVDPETGVWDVLNMVAVDDCGVRINPMIVEGQIMGGLTEAYAMANMQFITFDAEGNCVGSNYMDYLLPTAWETPGFELHSEVVTPSPHHPIGAKGIGECAAVGGPAAFVNAVLDAIAGTGVRNIDMPLLPDRVWEAITYRHDVSGARRGRSDDGRTADGGRLAGDRASLGAGRARRGSRARHCGLAAGPVVGPGRGAGDHHRVGAGARVDRRRLRRAVGHPPGRAGYRRRDRAVAAARKHGQVRRRHPGRNDRGADLLPERGGA